MISPRLVKRRELIRKLQEDYPEIVDRVEGYLLYEVNFKKGWCLNFKKSWCLEYEDGPIHTLYASNMKCIRREMKNVVRCRCQLCGSLEHYDLTAAPEENYIE